MSTQQSQLPKVPYVFWWNEKRYTVDAELFKKLSNKFARDLEDEDKQNQQTITDVMDEDTFKAFLAACQFQHYDITKKNAHDLLKLARKWEVPSLYEYVDEYIKKNEIQEDRKNYLNILVEKVKTDSDTKEDWTNVAFDINRYMNEEPFKTLPPEVIYQILAIADRKYLDQQIFNDFVLDLFKTNPTNAVPLMLRLDFSLLTDDQIASIFETKNVHQMNINFFTAASLSAVTNKARLQLQNEEIRQKINLDVFRVKNMIHQNSLTEDIQSDYSKEVSEIRETISKQKQQIEQLSRDFDIHNDRMKKIEHKITSSRTPCDRTVLATIQNNVRDYVDKTTTEVNKQLEKHFQKMNGFYNSVPKQTDDYFREQTMNGDNEHFKSQFLLNSTMERNHQVNAAIDKMKEQMTDVKAMLCAKVVRDKLRYDEFLRKNLSKKFNIFDVEPSIWGIRSNQVKDQYERLQKMEAQLDAVCPTRQGEKASSKKK